MLEQPLFAQDIEKNNSIQPNADRSRGQVAASQEEHIALPKDQRQHNRKLQPRREDILAKEYRARAGKDGEHPDD